MEPKLPTPNFQSEQAPISYDRNAERIPSVPSVEISEKGVEKSVDRKQELQIPAAPALPSPVQAATTSPLPSQTSDTAASLPGGVSDAPLVAADEDLIEKEWVDKAKKIVEETHDDPYRREQEVGKLQADYLRKRYGKELHTS